MFSEYKCFVQVYSFLMYQYEALMVSVAHCAFLNKQTLPDEAFGSLPKNITTLTRSKQKVIIV